MRALLPAAVALVLGCDGGGERPAAAPDPAPESPATGVASPAELTSWRSPERGRVGVVVAQQSVDVPSRSDGIIAAITVGVGDRVELGQPVARIDEAPIREELAMMKASDRAARAQARRAAVAARAARAAAERYGAATEAVSEAKVDEMRAAADEAQATRAEALANAAAARAQVEKLERMLGETVITAPFTGTVSQRHAATGDHVSRGDPVVRLIASGELRVNFAIPIEETSRYRVGEVVEVALEDSDRVLEGTVERVAPDLDPVAQMVIGEVSLAATDEVRAGMAVWVRSTNPDPTPGELD